MTAHPAPAQGFTLNTSEGVEQLKDIPVQAGPANRAEAAAAQIARYAAEAAPGAWLGSKEDLRSLCSVSVGTFNEALKIAQTRGMVTLRRGPGGGIFAAALSPLMRMGNQMQALENDGSIVADATRMRDVLDRLVIEDALMYSSAADIAVLRKEVDAMRAALEAGDVRAFMRGNWASERHVALLSPNPLLRTVYVSLLEILEQHVVALQTQNDQPVPEAMAERLDRYVRMADALDSRDRDAALRIVVEHRAAAQPAPSSSV